LEFRAISYIWKAITAKRMEIDPYCQWQNCRPQCTFQRCIDFLNMRSSARGLQLHYTASCGFVSNSWAFLFALGSRQLFIPC